MSRIAYVNGLYVPHRGAAVHIEDRGYQFADGVYEVIAVVDGRLVDLADHLWRLERSLGELRIRPPMSRAALCLVAAEVLRRNRVRDGMLYIQMTRGVARRDHPFPENVSPSLVMTARPVNFETVAERARAGVRVITMRDVRWERCDIKSIALLPNVLAKQAAFDAGAREVWMTDAKGFITEGAATNAWIVDKRGRLRTRPAENAILEGITRRSIIRLAHAAGLTVREEAFTAAEARTAREAFMTSTTAFLTPVVQIDDTVIDAGKPGKVATRLLADYRRYLHENAADPRDIAHLTS